MFTLQQPTQNEGEVRYSTSQPRVTGVMTTSNQSIKHWLLIGWKPKLTWAGQLNTQPHSHSECQPINSQAHAESSDDDITMATATDMKQMRWMWNLMEQQMKTNQNKTKPTQTATQRLRQEESGQNLIKINKLTLIINMLNFLCSYFPVPCSCMWEDLTLTITKFEAISSSPYLLDINCGVVHATDCPTNHWNNH